MKSQYPAGGWASLALATWMIAASAQAQVTLDNQSSIPDLLTSAANTTVLSHTTAVAQNRILLVSVHLNVTLSTGTTVASVTYGGQPLSLLQGISDGAPDTRTEVWYMVAPPIGANNVLVTAGGIVSGTVQALVGATTFRGVEQVPPSSNSNTGSSSPASVTVTGTSVNDVVIDFVTVRESATLTATSPQDVGYHRNTGSTASNHLEGATSRLSGAAGTTPMRWTFGLARNWTQIGVRLARATADVELSHHATPDPVEPGGVLSYTTHVQNNGPSTATGVTVTGTLPASVTFIASNTTLGSCSGSGPVTCNLGTMTVGQTATVTIQVTAPLTGGLIGTSSATVTTSTIDTGAPNTASANAWTLVQSTLCGTQPGKDGAGGTLVGIVNSYWPGTTASVAAGATGITLGIRRGAPVSITSGDLLLIIQMQDAAIDSNNDDRYGSGAGITGGTTGIGAGISNPNNTGRYEYAIATNTIGAGGGGLTLTGTGGGGGLLFAYTNAAATATMGQRRYQVVRVPQYTTATLGATLTAESWNGTSGGILAFDVAGDLALGGTTVSVNGLGFRGGAGLDRDGNVGGTSTDYRSTAATLVHGIKGEGIAGTPTQVFNNGVNTPVTVQGYPNGDFARGAPGNAGGGGTDADAVLNQNNSGGGGGGNWGRGGGGGHAWGGSPLGGFGGAPFYSSPGRVVLGGGGGAGSRNNSSLIAGAGGVGGGIVLVRAGRLTGTGTITANGANAFNDTVNDGAGGGGAGGSILILARGGGLGGLTARAQGGRGGDAWRNQPPGVYPGERHGPGGGGGGGFIATSGTPASSSVTGGAPGITTTANDTFGATAGTAGTVVTDALATRIAGVVSGCADLSVTSSDFPDPVSAGNLITWTQAVTNHSTVVPAYSMTLTQSTPGGTTFVSMTPPAGWTCPTTPAVGGTGSIVCNASGPLAPGASTGSFALVLATSPALADGSALNQTTSVSSAMVDLNSANDQASTQTTVRRRVDLAASVTPVPTEMTLGEGDITFTVTVSNQGPSRATNVVLTSDLPDSSAFVAVSPGSPTCTLSSGVVTCVFAVLDPGAIAAVTITVTPTAAGPSTLTASVTRTEVDTDVTNDVDSGTTTVDDAIDLAIASITDSPTDITLGQGNVTYTIEVANLSSRIATDVHLTANLPASSTFVSHTVGGGGSCSESTPGVVTCSWVSLAGGATVTATVTVTPGTGGTNTLSASVASSQQSDTATANNSDSETTTVNAAIDLAIASITDSPTDITLGQGDVTYTIEVANLSSSAATDLVLTANLPASSTFVSSSAAGGGSCSESTPGVVSCSWASLAGGATVTATITVTPGTGGTNTLSASVASSQQPDGAPANNSQSETTTVNAAIDLAIASITDSPTAITLGQGDVTYTIEVANLSSSGATDLVLTANLPASSTFVSSSAGGGGSCSESTPGVVSCSWASLAGGATVTATVTVTPGTGGTNTLNASVASSQQPDGAPANNSQSETTTVNAAIDLAIASITDSPTAITLGQGDVTYTIEVANLSSSGATDLQLTANLPPSSTFVSSSAGGGGSCSESTPGVVTCTWVSLASGATVTATITVTPGAGGSNTLSASVSGTQPDTAPGNNSQSETTTIRENQTIDFDPVADPLLSAGTVPLVASATSGLTVTFTSLTPLVCGVSGMSATLLDPGTCTIEAQQEGDGEWAAAPPVNASFEITADPAAFSCGTSQAPSLGSVSGIVYFFDRIAVDVTTTAGEAVGNVVITQGGSGYLNATVTFSAPPSGTTATGDAVVNDGRLVAVTITNAGSGYATAPTITIVGSGTDAAATAILTSSQLTTKVAFPTGLAATSEPAEVPTTPVELGRFYSPVLSATDPLTLTTIADGSPIVTLFIDKVGAPQAQARVQLWDFDPQTLATVLIGQGFSTTVSGNSNNALHTVTTLPIPAGTTIAPNHRLLWTIEYISNNQSSSINLRFDGTDSPAWARVCLTKGSGSAPELSLQKTPSPDTYASTGEVIGYSYEVTNSGEVTLPGPFTVTDDKTAVTCPSVTGLPPHGALTCTASYAIVQGDLDAGFVTNRAAAASGAVGSLPATATVTAGFLVDLRIISLVASPSTITLGDGNVDYTIGVENASTSVTATGVTLTGTIPGLSTYVTSSASGAGSCGESGGVVTCTWSSLAALESVSATITVTPGARGPNTLSASVSGDEADAFPLNNSGSATSAVTMDQGIDFDPIADQLFSAGTVPLVASADSGMAVTFTSLTPLVCGVSGESASLLAPGTCTIQADQAGDDEWNAAPPVSVSFEVVADPVAPTITSGAPPDGTFGLAYDFTVTATGDAPITFGATGLPPGLAIDPATGSITGTPTSAGTFSGTITATNGVSPDASQDFTIEIAKADQAIAFDPVADHLLSAGSVMLVATADSALEVTFTSLTPLVCGVSGASATLVDTGTCTIQADQGGDDDWNAAPPTTESFEVEADPVAPTITSGAPPDGTFGAPYSFTVAATGDAPITYGATGLPPGLAIDPTTGAITGTPTAAGTFSGTITAANGVSPDATQEFTIEIATADQAIAFDPIADQLLSAGSVTLVASADSGLAVTFTSLTPLVCGISGASATILDTGTCTIQADQGGDDDWNAAPPVIESFEVDADPVAPAITSGPPPDGTFGAPYSFTVAATGDAPITYGATGLPPGLAIDPTTGAITGTPTAAGTFSGTITAANGVSPDATQGFTIEIAKADQAIDFDPVADQLLSAGSVTLVASADSGLVVTFTSFTPLVCEISGASATILDTGTCTIQADQGGDDDWNAAPPVIESFEITIDPVAPTITSGPPPDGSFNATYTFTVTAAGDAPITFGTTGLPPGLAIDPATGAITGTPLAAGTYSGTITASNGVSPDATQEFTIEIAKADQTIAFDPVADQLLSAGSVLLAAAADSGLEVTFTSLTPLVCEVSGSSATILDPGTCTIQADQGGDDDWNAAPPVIESFEITIDPVAPTITSGPPPDGTFNASYTFTVTATGDAPITFGATGLPPGLAIDPSTGAITGTPTATGTYSGTITAANGVSPDASQEFTIEIAKADQTIAFDPVADQLLSAGSVPLVASADSGLAVTFTSLTPLVCEIAGASATLLDPGTCTIQADQGGDDDWNAASPVTESFEITVDPVAPTITSGPPPDGTFNAPYTFTVTATGDAPITFGTIGLPPGLDIDPSTGAITGTPTAAGTYSGTITATNGVSPDASQEFTIEIGKADQAIAFDPIADQMLSAGSVLLVAAADSGLEVSFSSLTPLVCEISGSSATLLDAGTCTVQADQAGDDDWNPAPPVSAAFEITDGPAAPAITSDPPPDGTWNDSYAHEVTATGTGPIVYSAVGLPPGLVLDPATGLISGVPSTPGTWSGTITASGPEAPPATQTFTIVIAKASQTLSIEPIQDQPFAVGTIELTSSATSGLPVSFSSLTPAVCEVSGSTVTFLSPGGCSIQADQDGDELWNAAPPQTVSFVITADAAAIPTLSFWAMLVLIVALAAFGTRR